MTDDGTGGGIRIPSMLIGLTDGKKLLDFLRRATSEEKNKTVVAVGFYVESEKNKAEYDIWYTSSNDRALDFISDFQEMDSKLGN